MPDRVSYVPGPGGTALVGPATVMLVPTAAGELADSTVAQLWGCVQEATNLQEVVEAVLEVGLKGLPSFGLLELAGEAPRLLLRGDVVALVSRPGAPGEAVSAEGAVTWREHAVAGDSAVELAIGDAPLGPVRPLLGGIVDACRLRVGEPGPFPDAARASAEPQRPAVPPEPGPDEATAALAEPAGAQPAGLVTPDGALVVAAPAEARGAAPAAAGSPAPVDAPAGADAPPPPGPSQAPPPSQVERAEPPAPDGPEQPDPRATLGYLPGADGTAGLAMAGGPEGEAEGPAAGAEAPGPAAEVVDEFDALFGETQFRSLEGAAVRPVEEPGADEAPAPARAGGSAGPDRQAGDAPGPLPFLAVAPQSQVGSMAVPPVDSTGALIDAVPGIPGRPAGSAETALDDRGSGSASLGTTTSRPRRAARGSDAGAAPLAADGPVVTGVLCPAGHANPPQVTACRVCGHPIGTLNPVSMRRPVLGALVFSNGTEVVLDRSVIVGRSPKAERISGKEIPQLVTLPSPEQEISRNHLEVRLDGWHVLVVDLDSTNGTVVTLPGKAPERLRAGEEYPITPGTVVSVADEVTFEYQVGE